MIGIYNLFQSIYPLPEKFWAELKISIEERTLSKKTLLLKEGDVCNEIHFLTKGLARAYYFNEDQEITSWLMKENDLIISVQSFYTRQPGYEFMELIEDSTLISLSYELLQHFYKKFPEFNFVARVLTEKYYVLSEERSYSLRMQTSQSRYESLLSQHPEFFQRVPLKYIASYLGMQPETLSRLRSSVR